MDVTYYSHSQRFSEYNSIPTTRNKLCKVSENKPLQDQFSIINLMSYSVDNNCRSQGLKGIYIIEFLDFVISDMYIANGKQHANIIIKHVKIKE